MAHGTDIAAARAAVDATGMHLVTEFAKIDGAVASGSAAQIEAARTQPGVTYLEGNTPIEFCDSTSHPATRGAEAVALKIDVVYIPTAISLAVIATVIGVSIWLSLRATRGQGRQSLDTPAAPPFRVATEAETAELESVWSRRRAESAGRSDEHAPA